MANPWIVDAINSNYFGHKLEEKHLDNGRMKVQARLVAFKPMHRGKRKWIPYELDPEQDIVKTYSDAMEKEVWILVNNSGVPQVRHEHSDYAKLVDGAENVQELSEQVQRLKDRIGAKDKRIEELERKVNESGKHEDEGRKEPKIPCHMCGEEWAESTWKQNDGDCNNEDCQGYRGEFGSEGDYL